MIPKSRREELRRLLSNPCRVPHSSEVTYLFDAIDAAERELAAKDARITELEALISRCEDHVARSYQATEIGARRQRELLSSIRAALAAKNGGG